MDAGMLGCWDAGFAIEAEVEVVLKRLRLKIEEADRINEMAGIQCSDPYLCQTSYPGPVEATAASFRQAISKSAVHAEYSHSIMALGQMTVAIWVAEVILAVAVVPIQPFQAGNRKRVQNFSFLGREVAVYLAQSGYFQSCSPIRRRIDLVRMLELSHSHSQQPVGTRVDSSYPYPSPYPVLALDPYLSRVPSHSTWLISSYFHPGHQQVKQVQVEPPPAKAWSQYKRTPQQSQVEVYRHQYPPEIRTEG